MVVKKRRPTFFFVLTRDCDKHRFFFLRRRRPEISASSAFDWFCFYSILFFQTKKSIFWQLREKATTHLNSFTEEKTTLFLFENIRPMMQRRRRRRRRRRWKNQQQQTKHDFGLAKKKTAFFDDAGSAAATGDNRTRVKHLSLCFSS